MNLGPWWYVILWGIWATYRRDWVTLLSLVIFGVISTPVVFWFNDRSSPTWAWIVSGIGVYLLIGTMYYHYRRERRR